MDGGSNLNLIYQDTICGMGLDPTKIRHSNTTFKGVTPGPGDRCTGSLLLQVIFGCLSPRSPATGRLNRSLSTIAITQQVSDAQDGLPLY